MKQGKEKTQTLWTRYWVGASSSCLRRFVGLCSVPGLFVDVPVAAPLMIHRTHKALVDNRRPEWNCGPGCSLRAGVQVQKLGIKMLLGAQFHRRAEWMVALVLSLTSEGHCVHILLPGGSGNRPERAVVLLHCTFLRTRFPGPYLPIPWGISWNWLIIPKSRANIFISLLCFLNTSPKRAWVQVALVASLWASHSRSPHFHDGE